MAKNDQGYRASTRRSRGSSSFSGSGNGPREQSKETYLAKTRKDVIADMYVRTLKSGILDVLGLGRDSAEYDDIAMSIKQVAEQEMAGKTKAEIDEMFESARSENNSNYGGYMAEWDVAEMTAAQGLMDALYAATRMRERADLDDGDLLDDAVNLIADGEGWGEETTGRLEVRKHINIAIDNSGSTHTAETGFCHRALLSIAKNVMRVLHTAGKSYDRVTYDVFSFNRVAVQHTGYYGMMERKELAYNQLRGIEVEDPLRKDSTKTNLAPLLERFHMNEVRRNKIGEPRIDIILTDGEFETKADLNRAVEWQRRRGPNVNTYVLNVCPEDLDNNLPLPHQFQVVPVHCLTPYDVRLNRDGTERIIKKMDNEILGQAVNRIVMSEVANAAQE